MKIRVTRQFRYTWDNVKTHELSPGEYEVPRQVSERAAQLAISFGAAVIVPTFQKVAPENKIAEVEETKAEEKPRRHKKRRNKALFGSENLH